MKSKLNDFRYVPANKPPSLYAVTNFNNFIEKYGIKRHYNKYGIIPFTIQTYNNWNYNLFRHIEGFSNERKRYLTAQPYATVDEVNEILNNELLKEILCQLDIRYTVEDNTKCWYSLDLPTSLVIFEKKIATRKVLKDIFLTHGKFIRYII